MSDATAGEGKPLGSGRLAQRDPPVDGPFFSEKVVELTATRKSRRVDCDQKKLRNSNLRE